MTRRNGNAIRPQLLEIGPACTIGCSLSLRRLPIAEIVTGWYSAGYNNEIIRERAIAAGFTLSVGAIARHRQRHLIVIPDAGAVGIDDGSAYSESGGEKVDHVKVLEAIIARGARSISSWRVGPDMTIKAMDMWYRLTQGNAQQSWMDEMAAAIAGMAPDEGPKGKIGGHQASDDEIAALRLAEDPSSEEVALRAEDGAA